MTAKTNKANLDLLITDPESAQSKLNEMQKKFEIKSTRIGPARDDNIP